MTSPAPQWLESGKPLGGTASISLSGPLKFSGGVGGTECTFNGEAALVPGTSGFAALEASPASCKLIGGLKTACTSVTGVTSEQMPWTVNVGEAGGKPVANVSGLKVTYTYKGGIFCPKAITVSGNMTTTPDNSAAIASLSASGELSASIGEKVSLSGSLAVSPAGTYGIGAVPDTVALHGSMGWSGAQGGIQCTSVDGNLTLSPGSQGQLTSLSVGGCTMSGAIASSCTGVSVLATGLPQTVTAEGSGASRAINVPVGLEVKFTGGGSCPSKWTFSGNLTAVPDNADAITSTELSGVLSGSFSATWSAELGWSPAGTYGIQ